LEKQGIKVDISTELETNVLDYDLVHIFNLMRAQEVYYQIKNAKNHSKPVVLSTIYGFYSEYKRRGRGGLAQVVANILSPFQSNTL
jgi:hypothetical protein